MLVQHFEPQGRHFTNFHYYYCAVLNFFSPNLAAELSNMIILYTHLYLFICILFTFWLEEGRGDTDQQNDDKNAARWDNLNVHIINFLTCRLKMASNKTTMCPSHLKYLYFGSPHSWASSGNRRQQTDIPAKECSWGWLKPRWCSVWFACQIAVLASTLKKMFLKKILL